MYSSPLPRPEGRAFCLTAALRARGASRSTGTKIDYLLLFNVGFRKEVELEKKVSALGGKYHHMLSIVEETIAWKDEYLNLLEIEELFGMSAEKIAEAIVSGLKNGSRSY